MDKCGLVGCGLISLNPKYLDTKTSREIDFWSFKKHSLHWIQRTFSWQPIVWVFCLNFNQRIKNLFQVCGHIKKFRNLHQLKTNFKWIPLDAIPKFQFSNRCEATFKEPRSSFKWAWNKWLVSDQRLWNCLWSSLPTWCRALSSNSKHNRLSTVSLFLPAFLSGYWKSDISFEIFVVNNHKFSWAAIQPVLPRRIWISGSLYQHSNGRPLISRAPCLIHARVCAIGASQHRW